MSAPKKWGHDELATDLANHLRTVSDVMAWENMQLGPSGSPRPDVFAVKKSFSRFAPIAYEAKISVSDFRSDVTSGKWQNYLQFASAVVFAAPAGLITKADIPAGCGLILRHESGWKVAKGPTLNSLGNLPRDAWLKLLMDGLQRETERQLIKSRGDGDIWSVEQKLRRKLGDEVARLVRDAHSGADMLKRSIEDAQRQRDEIQRGVHADVKRDVQWHKEALDREAARINEAQMELARALGLPPEVSAAGLAQAMREAARRIEGDREVQRLRDFFKRVQDMSRQGVDPMPGIDAVPVPAAIWQQPCG